MYRANFHGELNPGNEDLRVLFSIIQTVHKSTDLKEIYKVALDSVKHIENVDSVMIYLVDEEKQEAVLEAHMNVPEEYIRRAGRIPYPKGITWKVINSGKILNVENITKNLDLCPDGRDLGCNGALSIPIFLEKKVIGAIWFLSNKGHKFDEREVNLLSVLGGQVAIAIAKAKYTRALIEAHELLEEQNNRLLLLTRISQAIHQSIDLKEIYDTFTDAIQNLNLVPLMFVFMVEGKERQDVLLQAHYISNKMNFNLLSRIQYLKEITYKVINSGEFGYYRSVSDLSMKALDIEGTFEKRSLLSIPIKLGDQILGAVHYFSVQGQPFTEQEMDFLLFLGNQFGIAIAKAKVLEEIKKSKEELKESEQRYNVLAEHAYDLIFEVSADARCLFISSKYKDMLGYEPDELLGRNIFEKIHTDDQPYVMAEFARAAKTLSSAQVVYRYRHKNGGWVWLESTGKAYKTSTGEIRGVIASRDITHRKRVENAILKSKKSVLTNNQVENAIIKVGMVTVSPIVQEGMYKILGSAEDIKVIDMGSDHSSIVSTAEQERIDVLILDTSIQEINFREILESISPKHSKTKLLLLSQELDEEMSVEAISLGVAGILTNRLSAEQLIRAIKAVNGEEIWADRRTIKKVLSRLIPLRKGKLKLIKSDFTRREQEILGLLTKGQSNKYISKKLSISESTLKTHLTRIFRKLNVSNRFELFEKIHGERFHRADEE